MKSTFYPANGRGTSDHGWLKANFSFSFAGYHNPDKVHFGALRVLNDDIIAGGTGFGTHPHDNMEIITIPLQGALEHKDSMGNIGVIHAGEVQVMSAGTGVEHSEYNHSKTEPANTLQIWLLPKFRNIAPRYDQRDFKNAFKKNEFTTLVTGDKNVDALWINQDATFSIGEFDAGQTIIYDIKNQGNGAYIFVLEGVVKINDQLLNKKDALGVIDTSSITIDSQANTRLLIIEVPMLQ
ncbi:pirin family protein [Mucilaginibacter sp. UR6-11]|uniref:pirin family protein n=1 Tax=Mucilaginibacter sp. UR6-11 TaxID=1435644 RepID=UPI001E5C714F|nr:pirin family protein [Mucilaginibacter sp. UR6-11]MCC8424568.1 pirin family protein [Mucilaginibacter sp. UR6-11]